jgi:hypothetical protein
VQPGRDRALVRLQRREELGQGVPLVELDDLELDLLLGVVDQGQLGRPGLDLGRHVERDLVAGGRRGDGDLGRLGRGGRLRAAVTLRTVRSVRSGMLHHDRPETVAVPAALKRGRGLV